MRNLANAIHMVANYNLYFSHWDRVRYGRMWINFNLYEAMVCRYYDRSPK